MPVGAGKVMQLYVWGSVKSELHSGAVALHPTGKDLFLSSWSRPPATARTGPPAQVVVPGSTGAQSYVVLAGAPHGLETGSAHAASRQNNNARIPRVYRAITQTARKCQQQRSCMRHS